MAAAAATMRQGSQHNTIVLKKLGIFKTRENGHSMMKQCCQRGHEKNPYPLQSVHMHHPVRAGFDPQPPRPKLPRNLYKVASISLNK